MRLAPAPVTRKSQQAQPGVQEWPVTAESSNNKQQQQKQKQQQQQHQQQQKQHQQHQQHQQQQQQPSSLRWWHLALACAASFAGALAASIAATTHYRSCVRPRRVFEEILGVCRDASADAVTAAYYSELKVLATAQAQQDLSAGGSLKFDTLHLRRLSELEVAFRVLTSERGDAPRLRYEDEDVAPAELQMALDGRLRSKSGWSFQGASNGDSSQPRFWPLLTSRAPAGGLDSEAGAEAGVEEPLARRLWGHLKPLLLPGRYSVLRAYANGQLFGTDGSPHRDACPSPPHYTLLYYPHSLGEGCGGQDSEDPGGETLFFGSASGQVLAAVPLLANSAPRWTGPCLTAPAMKGDSDELRVTVAFKLRREGDVQKACGFAVDVEYTALAPRQSEDLDATWQALRSSLGAGDAGGGATSSSNNLPRCGLGVDAAGHFRFEVETAWAELDCPAGVAAEAAVCAAAHQQRGEAELALLFLDTALANVAASGGVRCFDASRSDMRLPCEHLAQQAAEGTQAEIGLTAPLPLVSCLVPLVWPAQKGFMEAVLRTYGPDCDELRFFVATEQAELENDLMVDLHAAFPRSSNFSTCSGGLQKIMFGATVRRSSGGSAAWRGTPSSSLRTSGCWWFPLRLLPASTRKMPTTSALASSRTWPESASSSTTAGQASASRAARCSGCMPCSCRRPPFQATSCPTSSPAPSLRDIMLAACLRQAGILPSASSTDPLGREWFSIRPLRSIPHHTPFPPAQVQPGGVQRPGFEGQHSWNFWAGRAHLYVQCAHVNEFWVVDTPCSFNSFKNISMFDDAWALLRLPPSERRRELSPQ
ncbi:unnamed protein product [Polarella glacialis]|uniref:Uncharacterized protein n=1 Tax=Polarella glacialis TaxID=89957 RepID=A0A813E6W2_POLGL|nr:unnamed protein product [Polarella glacialis]